VYWVTLGILDCEDAMMRQFGSTGGRTLQTTIDDLGSASQGRFGVEKVVRNGESETGTRDGTQFSVLKIVIQKLTTNIDRDKIARNEEKKTRNKHNEHLLGMY